MKLALSIVLVTVALSACDSGATIPEEVRLSIAVTGGEVHSIPNRAMCDAVSDTGPVVLLLHGASFNAGTWVETGTHEALCEAGIAALSIDLPGFGNTARFNHDPIQLLDDVVGFVNDRVVIVSPSMSGSYSLPWLATNPPAAAGFVPVAPVGIGSWVTPLGFAVPTLGIWGGDDAIVPVSEGTRLISSIPGAELVVFEGGHHAVYKFDADRFNHVLIEFVQSLNA